MLKILVVAIIFSVEIFSSVAFAQPRVMVVAAGASEFSELAAEFVQEKLSGSDKFNLILNNEEFDEFRKNFPEYAELKPLVANYIVVSQLEIEPAGRADKFKITHRVDFVQDSAVIWSGEADKKFSAKKATEKNWRDAVYRLTGKVMKKFFRAIDSGKIVLKED